MWKHYFTPIVEAVNKTERLSLLRPYDPPKSDEGVVTEVVEALLYSRCRSSRGIWWSGNIVARVSWLWRWRRVRLGWPLLLLHHRSFLGSQRQIGDIVVKVLLAMTLVKRPKVLLCLNSAILSFVALRRFATPKPYQFFFEKSPRFF